MKRLRQLEDAKTKLGAKDPKVSDINQEIQAINSKLKPEMRSNIPDDVSDEQYGDYFDQQSARSQAQNEPFGQDLNAIQKQQEEEQKQRVAEQVIKNEPENPSAAGNGPQAKASAKPSEDVSQKTLKPNNKPPGGLASRARRFLRLGVGSGAGGASTTAEGGAGATGGASQASKQMVNAATQAAKKFAQQAIKKIAMSLAANPITWIVVGIGLVLIIIFFIVGISYMGTISSKKPSTSGGTPLVAVSAKTDSGTLQNFMKLSGDKTVADQAINEATSTMNKNLLETKEQIKTNPALVKAIDTALGSLGILEGSKTSESATTFLTDLSEVYNLMEGNIPVWASGSTRLPVAGTVTVFNNELHGFSFLKNEAVENHNVYIRSDDGQAKCDAVDIGVTTGEAVYPIFGGKVTDVSTDGEGSDASKVIVASSDGKYTALYAHIKTPTKVKGATITTSEPLGVAKTNNIQIEIFYTENKENTCLVTNHADMIDHASTARRHQDWGGYLWDRIKTTFNLK